MKDYTVRRASKLKGPLLVFRKNRWELVTEIRKWGKNWQVTTDHGYFVVGDEYLIHKPNAKELRQLLS